VQIWDPDLAVEAGGGSLSFALSGAAADSVALRFEEGARWSAPVWEIEAGDDLLLDRRILEDASVGVVALSHSYVENSAGSFDILQRSGKVALNGSAGPPPSRGATCSIFRGDGSERVISPCDLTDGDLTGGYAASDEEPCEQDDEVCREDRREHTAVIDLGSERAIEFIVARSSVYGRARVEISSDKSTWQAVGSADSGGFTIETGGDAAARYVRLRAESDQGSIAGAKEISVW